MIVREFPVHYSNYTDFAVWEIENIDSFFDGNGVLAIIFQDRYQFPVEEFHQRRHEIAATDMSIMTTLLDLVDDKHFFVFTLHDENHLELVKMQLLKVMNFGMDIQDIQPDRVYVMMMDKKPGSGVSGEILPN